MIKKFTVKTNLKKKIIILLKNITLAPVAILCPKLSYLIHVIPVLWPENILMLSPVSRLKVFNDPSVYPAASDWFWSQDATYVTSCFSPGNTKA